MKKFDPKDFELSNVIKIAEEIVSENPDYVYESPVNEDQCVYFDEFDSNLPPSCIVGHIFDHLGYDYSSLCEQFGHNFNINAIGSMLEPYIDDADILGFLSSLQNFQDTGRSWSESFNLTLKSRFKE